MSVKPGGLRVLAQHLLPQTTIVIVLWDGQLIGTVSLIEESPFGLPMESSFELASRRFCGNRLAELSSLAIAPEHRGKTETLFFPLLKFLYHFMVSTGRIDEVTIAVEPKMADLYQALMLYRPLSTGQKRYEATNSVRAVALHRNLRELDVDARRVYGQAPTHRNLWAYFNSDVSFVLNKSQKMQNSTVRSHYMTPELMHYLLIEESDLRENMADEKFELLERIYSEPNYHAVFAKMSRHNLIEFAS